MIDNYTVVAFIKNEPIRILPLIENFNKSNKLLILLDPDDILTKEILIKNNIKFILRPKNFYELDIKYRENWILSKIETEYVLTVYASMFFSKKILEIYDNVAKEGLYDAVYNPIISWSHAKMVLFPPLFVKDSTACYFFRKSVVESDYSIIHGEFFIKSSAKVLKLPATNEFAIQIFRDDDMKQIAEKHISYAEREANEKIGIEKKITLNYLIYQLLKSFLNGYIRCGGYKAGIEGFIYHFNFTIYNFFVISKLWEIQNSKTFNKNREIHSKIRMGLLNKKSNEYSSSNINTNV